jgi:hypothetical protein
MATKRKKKQVPPEQVAQLIEEIAKRVETLNYSSDVQVSISAVGEMLTEIHHPDGLKLVNRIGLLLTTENGKVTSNRYGGYVQKQLAKMPPLDPIADSAALRALAVEIADTSKIETSKWPPHLLAANA